MKQVYLTGQVTRKMRVQDSGRRKILNHEDCEEKTGGRGFGLRTFTFWISDWGLRIVKTTEDTEGLNWI